MDLTKSFLRLPQSRLRFDEVLGSWTGKPLDVLYSRLGSLNGSFFAEGWGDLDVIDYEESIKLMQKWPPNPGLQMNWKLLSEATHNGVKFKHYEADFKTPCMKRVYDALPEASRTARVQMLVPSAAQDLSGFVHLSGTGDESFTRRLQIGLPLICQGVATLALESPFYGRRRPSTMHSSKLLRVSDLLVLGWATIFESMHLLHWMRTQGYSATGMTGLSMGGVHACLTASLYPEEIAVVPCLTPRSAAVAYCHGAMRDGVGWDSLHQDLSTKHDVLHRAMHRASQPVLTMRGARFNNYLQHGKEAPPPQHLHRLRHPLPPSHHHTPSDQADTIAGPLLDNPAGQQHRQRPLPVQHAASPSEQLRAHTTPSDFWGMGGSSLEQVGASHTHQREASTWTTVEHQGVPWGMPGPSTGWPGGASSVGPGLAAERGAQLAVGTSDSLEPPLLPGQLSTAEALASGSNIVGRMAQLETALRRPQLTQEQRTQLLETLTSVLETYTDIMRYPRPVRTDATVIVAANHDAYVSMDSVMEVHKYWEGSQLVCVPGGHVSGYLMHFDTFRRAMLTALDRVKQPASQALSCTQSAQMAAVQPQDSQHKVQVAAATLAA